VAPLAGEEKVALDLVGRQPHSSEASETVRRRCLCGREKRRSGWWYSLSTSTRDHIQRSMCCAHCHADLHLHAPCIWDTVKCTLPSLDRLRIPNSASAATVRPQPQPDVPAVYFAVGIAETDIWVTRVDKSWWCWSGDGENTRLEMLKRRSC
jgi:hypothetical protein